jgi:hypothetical protein
MVVRLFDFNSALALRGPLVQKITHYCRDSAPTPRRHSERL